MPKTYYRCSTCHRKYTEKGLFPDTICGNCCGRVYKCQHNYWWELLYLTIRTIFRSIKESWKVYLEYNRQIKRLRRSIEK